MSVSARLALVATALPPMLPACSLLSPTCQAALVQQGTVQSTEVAQSACPLGQAPFQSLKLTTSI